MILGIAVLVLGGGLGLLLALFGVKMLVTGRGPARTLRNFPGVRPAALYHLLFGLALLLLVLGQTVLDGSARTVASVLAVAMVAAALLRYRPRRREN